MLLDGHVCFFMIIISCTESFRNLGSQYEFDVLKDKRYPQKSGPLFAALFMIFFWADFIK